MTATTEWLEKDYYALLGVPETATDKEITKAYRKLARQLHPDTNPDKGDSDRFKDVAAAYDVLHDADKRREYDELRRLAAQPGRRRVPGGYTRTAGYGPSGGYTLRVDHIGDVGGFADFDVDDVLGSMFGDRRARTRRPQRGEDVAAELHLGFEEAVHGTTTQVPVPEDVACPSCEGGGVQAGTIGTPCPGCGGRGAHRRTRTVRACIPAGVDDGQTIRLKGRGAAGRDGGPPGDLLVRVHVAPHRAFGRRGRDLTVTVPVTFAEAALGADIAVPTLDEPVTVRVPPGTPTGKTFRVRGRGIRSRKETGDLLVTVEVSVPSRLNDRQRAAVEALAAATTTSPREHLRV